MPEPRTREQSIRRGKQFQRLVSGLVSITHKRRGKAGFVDTEFGRVRTLWYGFERPEKAALFFDLRGDGFILGGGIRCTTRV